MSLQRWFARRPAPEPPAAESAWPPQRPVPLPPGFSEEQILRFLQSAVLDDVPSQAELQTYARTDLRRFLHTLSLVPDGNGRLLEIGADPYFTTLLLKAFRGYALTLGNFFKEDTHHQRQRLCVTDIHSGQPVEHIFDYDHFNSETQPFPYADDSFDVVLLCEVIEHLVQDPVACLCEINRVLKTDGLLVLTTPNVCRLENILRMVAGANIYDPYSGYGLYARHNREYSRHEIYHLLLHCGFASDLHYAEDVTAVAEPIPRARLRELLTFRETDLGQYMFFRARKTAPARADTVKRPAWLYRSYPDGDLV